MFWRQATKLTGIAVAGVAMILTAGCETSWPRQDGGDENGSFRDVASDFHAAPSQAPIPAHVVEGVTLGPGRNGVALYIATLDRTFNIIDPVTGSGCTASTSAELTAAPTIAGGAAYLGGYHGNVWRFTGNCVATAGWPVKVADGATVVGPVLVYGDLVLAATQNNRINAISISGAPREAWHRDLPSTPTGSMAMTSMPDGRGGLKNVVLVSTREAGLAIINLDDNDHTLQMISTGSLRAGPSVSYPADPMHFTQIAVVPRYGALDDPPVVYGIVLSAQPHVLWTANINEVPQNTTHFETEASIAGERVYLTSSTHLVALSLSTGTQIWSQLLNDSGGAVRPATTRNDQVFVVDGNTLKMFHGADGTLLMSVPRNPTAILNLRPTIGPDGTVITGDSQSILQFH